MYAVLISLVFSLNADPHVESRLYHGLTFADTYFELFFLNYILCVPGNAVLTFKDLQYVPVHAGFLQALNFSKELSAFSEHHFFFAVISLPKVKVQN